MCYKDLSDGQRLTVKYFLWQCETGLRPQPSGEAEHGSSMAHTLPGAGAQQDGALLSQFSVAACKAWSALSSRAIHGNI